MRIILIFCFLFVSCASTHVMTEQEKSIRVERGSFSLEGCTIKGALKEDIPTYFGSDSYKIDHTGDALRKPAAKMGANLVIVTASSGIGGTATGIAYFCK